MTTATDSYIAANINGDTPPPAPTSVDWRVQVADDVIGPRSDDLLCREVLAELLFRPGMRATVSVIHEGRKVYAGGSALPPELAEASKQYQHLLDRVRVACDVSGATTVGGLIEALLDGEA